jgi:hypothetical protein
VEQLGQIDLAFCVDLTTSMTGFLAAARARMLDLLAGLRDAADAHLRVAVVGYQDYGRGGVAVRAHPFSPDPAGVRRVLDDLRVIPNADNTDAAEAVFAGLLACLDELEWRPHAVRLIVLVGDAPPHACGAAASPFPDRFPEADPSGQTLPGMSARVEEAGITLHALGMVPSVIPAHDAVTEACFTFLARSTGGTYRAARSSADALAVVKAIGQRAFGQLDFDRRLWARLTAGAPGAGVTAARVEELLPGLERDLGVSLYQLHAAVERLTRRGLLREKDA